MSCPLLFFGPFLTIQRRTFLVQLRLGTFPISSVENQTGLLARYLRHSFLHAISKIVNTTLQFVSHKKLRLDTCPTNFEAPGFSSLQKAVSFTRLSWCQPIFLADWSTSEQSVLNKWQITCVLPLTRAPFFDVQLHYIFLTLWKHQYNFDVCVFFSLPFSSPTILATCELMLSCKQYYTTISWSCGNSRIHSPC